MLHLDWVKIVKKAEEKLFGQNLSVKIDDDLFMLRIKLSEIHPKCPNNPTGPSQKNALLIVPHNFKLNINKWKTEPIDDRCNLGIFGTDFDCNCGSNFGSNFDAN